MASLDSARLMFTEILSGRFGYSTSPNTLLLPLKIKKPAFAIGSKINEKLNHLTGFLDAQSNQKEAIWFSKVFNPFWTHSKF